jgi:MarR family 2-MHQ and catechol resistance regulon transcriptional repressor
MTPRRHLKSIRLLAQCYQAFERMSGRHVRELGLTPAQFDIVATLGNTQGMSFRELGERTLITKGTLTGVVDRLEERGVLRRTPSPDDGRSTIVRLTPSGERLFSTVFLAHVEHNAARFDGWRDADFAALERELARLLRALAPDNDAQDKGTP